MEVLQLSHSDINGGAARAAYRIHHCLLDNGIDSRMWVNQALSSDWTVLGPMSQWEKLTAILRGPVGGQLGLFLKSDNPTIYSPSIISSRWVKRINESDAHVIHLHWVAGEMLSVADIGRIQKPVVWTLHDMWPFCGAEHYTNDYRWRVGYRHDNRPPNESGFDLNRWTWRRKRKHWKQPMHIVAPSRWLAKCASKSLLMCDWPVSVVPNPIDTERWKPLEKEIARELLRLPKDIPLLLFGAIGGERDPRKGFNLLLSALEYLRGETHVEGLELVVFGQCSPKSPASLGFPIHYTGHLYDDISLRALYSAVDALVVPSLQEAFGQIASEAHACGTPVISFDIGGLPDIVSHQRTGYLANVYDAEDLANGIIWVLERREKKVLSVQARESAMERFAYPVVAEQYRQIYQQY